MIEEKENKKKLGLLPKIGILMASLLLLLFIYMFFWEPKQLEIIEYPIMDDFSMLSNQLVEHVKLDISFSIRLC